MSVLYPSLEDLKVGQVIQVRNQAPFDGDLGDQH